MFGKPSNVQNNDYKAKYCKNGSQVTLSGHSGSNKAASHVSKNCNKDAKIICYVLSCGKYISVNDFPSHFASHQKGQKWNNPQSKNGW